MPVKVEKRDDEFCVIDPDGSTVKGGCHKIEKDAKAHARAINANTEKETKASYVPWNVTTFEELDQAEAAHEIAEHVVDLTWNFQDLVWNTMNSEQVIDKAAAIRLLADEYANRISSMDSSEKMVKQDLKQLNGSVVNKLIKATKKAFGIETKSYVAIYKDRGGIYRWVGQYSNCYRDDDRPPEIVSEKSHKGFVKLVDEGLAAKPTLWIWHTKQLEIGQSDWVLYDDSGFALAGGHFYDSVDEELIKGLSKLDDMAMSHGMPKWSIGRDEKDKSVITQHITEEISLLPGWAAANKRTGFVILDSSIKGRDEDMMAIPKEKRQELIDWGLNPSLIDALESQNSKQATEADLAEVERKEETIEEAIEVIAEEVVEEAQPETEEVAEPVVAEVGIDMPAIVSALNEAVKAILSVDERVKGVENAVKELQKSDEEKVAKKASNTSLASMQELLHRTVIGNDSARVDGRTSLGKSAPKEVAPEPEVRTGIPMIDGWLTRPTQV